VSGRFDGLTLVDTAGATLALNELWRERPALLIFYPGDETAVCTAQLCEYRDRWADFTAAGVALAGINPASHQRHGRFAANRRLPFPLYSDPGSRCCRVFGAKAWYGTRRLTVLVGRDGVELWRTATNPFFRPRADALLAAVRSHLAQPG
jgi:peroxiredoxin Q/BCP